VSCGAKVIGGGRSVAALEELASSTGVTPLPFDLESEDSIRDAVMTSTSGSGELRRIRRRDCDAHGDRHRVFDKVIRVNARGSLLVIKHTAPGMIARGKGGSIVNVSSQASLVALRGHVSYGASKAHWTASHVCQLWSSANMRSG